MILKSFFLDGLNKYFTLLSLKESIDVYRPFNLYTLKSKNFDFFYLIFCILLKHRMLHIFRLAS